MLRAGFCVFGAEKRKRPRCERGLKIWIHEAMIISPENIPDELRELPQFVGWRHEQRGGKRTKAPINPNSHGLLTYAKTNDRDTWSDFNTAIDACTKHPELAGIGFCLSPDDGLTALDLDHVIDTETCELKPEAVEIVERFNGTYWEVSPSGEGLRCFCKGKPKRSGKNVGKQKWLEVYSHPSNRYLTVTGNHWAGSAAEVTDQQEALDWLHSRYMEKEPEPKRQQPATTLGSVTLDDDSLLAKAKAARNGDEFDRLWSGDTSSHGGDESAADLALCNILAFWTNGDAARIDRLFRQSGMMRPKWDTRRGESTYGQMTIDRAIAGTRNGYEPRSRRNRNEASQPPSDLDKYRGTDDANAAIFLELHGLDVRFCPPWDKWLLWTGSHWRIDERLDVERLSSSVARHLYRVAGDEPNSKTRREIAGLAGKLEGTAKQRTMLEATKHRVVVHHSDLDKGHFLLNVGNGTIDLETGALRDHRRSDLLTHDTAIPYSQTARSPLWSRFLSEVFSGDADLVRFVQRAIGYSLTGDVREQILLICHGVGSNGKSVFLNILRALLGELALQAAPDLLIADRNSRHPTEQADLFGKRLVVCQETREGGRLNETLVKQLTGGDAVRARRMREDFWTFEPTHKLWLSTNHRPEIRGTDYAIWRRIRLIPFDVRFTDDGPNRKNPNIERELMTELPGILAWAVQGCLDWQRHGLKAPDAVTKATAGYQGDMDLLAAWIADCCVIDKTTKAPKKLLYESYCAWCEANGERPETQRKISQRLQERGFTEHKGGAGTRFWLGIGLLASDRQPPDRSEF